MIRKLRRSLLTIVALVPIVNIVCQAQSLPPLTHHVRNAVQNGQARPVGQLPSDRIMTLDVVLALRDQAGLDSFLKELYDPASFAYRRFLTPQEFTERFGPTQEDYGAVVRFAQANGFTVYGGTLDRRDVQIRGPVSAVETAFHVTMGLYQDSQNRTFYAPDREPTINLPFQLWHISGLDNYSNPHPMFAKKSDYAKAHGIAEEDVVPNATTGSGPSASFLGSDMRAAYYGATALTGAGQNLGLFEYLGTDLADLNTYYHNVGQTNTVPVTLLSTDGTSTSCVSPSCDDTEQTLDMTQALGMAPGLASMVVYVGGTDTAIISAMTTHNPLPTTIGCSWGWTPADPSTLDPYFQQMSTQGQNFFAASGDSSTWSSSNEAWPADDAYVVSVGGTDLTTAGAAGPWQSETAWSNSGGGISPDSIAIPSWQKLAGVINSSNRGSTTLRNGPDVSANANYTFYVCADQTTCTANSYGGTSFAAPMWAGYIALVNQQLVANGQPTIGFINPTIYAQNVTSSYATDFHDITSGTSGSFSAVTGYDLVTGWGSPNGTGLINALAGGGSSPAFTISASPTSVSVTQGSSGTSTITTSVSGGFNSAIALSASGQPTGVSVSFSPASIAAPGSGSSTMTMTVGSSTATGTYTITVTGTGGGLTHTASVSLTVTSGATPAFTIAASPTSVSVAQGSSGTSTITTTVSGGFNSAISLTASGQPSGTTVSFNPSSIAAPGSGSSTMTMTVGSSTATGTYSITVTGSGGGLTHTATVSLTVTSGTSPSFTIAASPTSVTVTQGNSGASTVTTTVAGGFNSAISLAASGQPAGTTVSFNPSSIPAPGSGSSTMTMTVGSSTAAGTYPITVTGSGGGITHTATVSLTVTTSGGGGGQLIVDGGFESATATGNSAPGWTGTTNISGHGDIQYHGSYPHTGSNYAYEGGSNSEKDTLTQTFTVPAGTTSAPLTFWVNVVTQETTRTTKYDFLYVEIHNSSGTLLATIKTLSNLDSSSDSNTNGTYFQVNAGDLSTYAGQTIELVFHCTTDVSLPTTFRIDDVSVNASGGGGGGGSFTISASPASVTVNQGSSGTSTISTSVSGGFNSAVALSASGLPSGATASFNPSSIAAPGSGSSTMTITAGSSTPTGAYSVTVTGSGGGVTQTTTVSLTVNASGGGGQLIVDGGFESATASGNSAPGWTGTTNISGHNDIIYHGSYPHTGTNYGFEGGNNNEVDTLTQTVTIPAGTSPSLTFWVNVYTQESPNTGPYDFMYVEIHNSSGTLLATPLTLTNNSSASDGNANGTYFQPAAIPLGAYAGQTIQIVFHATTDGSLYTVFRIDDVSLM